MPYSDPEKKREYMKRYNPSYYEANRDTRNLVTKNTTRKKSLRENKMEYVIECIGINCYYCGAESDGEIKISLEIDPSYKPLPKSLTDHSWNQIKIMSNSGVIKNICSVCKKIGTPEESH
jgi:hypothetical protein